MLDISHFCFSINSVTNPLSRFPPCAAAVLRNEIARLPVSFESRLSVIDHSGESESSCAETTATTVKKRQTFLDMPYPLALQILR